MDELTDQVFDTIVVGSGPGGAAVARELSLVGERVLILERGPNRPISGTLRQWFREAMIPGRSLLLTPQLLGMVRGITTGGTSVFYYASAFDPPYEMMARHGVDLSEEVEQLKRELPYAPLSDELIGPIASRIMESARELGLDWNPLPKLVFQDACRTDCEKCTLGCPHGAKWTSRVYVDEAVENGAVFLDRAYVRRVVVEDDTATGVEAHVRGRWHRFNCSRVVVSAGGIGSPVILRASGIEGAGFDYFFDPLVIVMGVADDVSGGREFPMAAGVHMEDEGYVLTDLVLPAPLYRVFTAQVFRFQRLTAHSHTLPIMVKIKDTLGGRLTDSGGVRKRLSDADHAKLAHGFHRAKTILENAGAGGVFKTWYLATHPGGSAKIGDVVDSNLATEVDNLYVCDCSVIPEEWGLPPSLTLLALGKRLARHLAA
jgi:choline dehydrogenase-like flavoprotein